MFDTALFWLIRTDSLSPPATCLNVKFYWGCDSHERWLPASFSVSSNFIYASNRWFCLNLQIKISGICAASNFNFHQSGLYLFVYWYFFKGKANVIGRLRPWQLIVFSCTCIFCSSFQFQAALYCSDIHLFEWGGWTTVCTAVPYRHTWDSTKADCWGVADSRKQPKSCDM